MAIATTASLKVTRRLKAFSLWMVHCPPVPRFRTGWSMRKLPAGPWSADSTMPGAGKTGRGIIVEVAGIHPIPAG